MRRLAGLALALLLLPSLAPLAAADHPGSNLGLARFRDLLGVAGPGGVTNVVHHLQDVDATFARWETTYPDLVDRLTIGQTSSGQPLLAVRVTDEAVAFAEAPLATAQKLRVYLDGGHHGNEYLGVELVMYYLEELLAKAAAKDPETAKFLQQTEVYATPIINVDGNTLDTRKNSRQVDPNRNYDFQWGGEGSGGSITDLNYHGPEAFSEAEVRANAEFGQELRPDLWITMHTGVAEFYWPWGWTMETSPDDAFFSSLEKPFEDATNGRVDAMQSAELYVAAGATDDYGYAVVGAPTFTYEVHEDQFIPLYGQPIPAVIADQLAGLHFMISNVKHMGAWLELERAPDGWLVRNDGWGNATNVTLTVAGDTRFLDFVPQRGSVLVADLPDGDATVTYPVLHINSTKTRTAHAASADVEPASATQDVPFAGAPLLVLAALAALALRRRQ